MDARTAQLESEIKKLKAEIQQLKVSHELENVFYELGGNRAVSEWGISSFDLLRPIIFDYLKFDEAGRFSIIDPRDGTLLKTDDGRKFGARDLMEKLKNSPVAGVMFESPRANGYILPSELAHGNINRETLRQVRDPAARLALAREHGIE